VKHVTSPSALVWLERHRYIGGSWRITITDFRTGLPRTRAIRRNISTEISLASYVTLSSSFFSFLIRLRDGIVVFDVLRCTLYLCIVTLYSVLYLGRRAVIRCCGSFVVSIHQMSLTLQTETEYGGIIRNIILTCVLRDISVRCFLFGVYLCNVSSSSEFEGDTRPRIRESRVLFVHASRQQWNSEKIEKM